MGKEIKLKTVELNGKYCYFAFPSQTYVNKFLDVLEHCEVCDIGWVGLERVAVRTENKTITLNEVPIMTQAEYNVARDAWDKTQKKEADKQKAELAKKEAEEEMELANQEVIEGQQKEAGIPESEIVEPGESDPRNQL